MARRSQSTDPRSRRLRESVKTAAMELVRGAPIDSFSLNDLLERSGVSRQGFYEHFDSRDDAVLHAITDDFADALETIDTSSSDPRRLLRALTHSVDGRREVYLHIRSAAIFDRVVEQWRTLMTPAVRSLAEAAANRADPPADREDLDALVSFTIGGIIELLRVWLRSDHPVSAAHQADLLWTQAQRSLGT